MTNRSFSCFLIGTESLLISCADVLRDKGHQILGVVSDEPNIVQWCADHGVRVISGAEPYGTVLAEQPFDYLLSITNLTIVPAEVLALPRRGAINFHDGPLPRFGGLYAPVWALMAGETEYAITWHRMTAAVDEGDIVLQRRFAVTEGETSLTLNSKCFAAGIDSFPELTDLLASETPPSTTHGLDRATYHGLSDRPRALAALDLTRPVAELAALVRALDFGGYANPVARPRLVSGDRAVLVSSVAGAESIRGTAGEVLSAEDGRLHLAARDGSLAFAGLATEDGAPLTGAEALAHLGLRVGERMPALTEQLVAAADAFSAKASRYEGAWASRLATLDPVELPYADRVSACAPQIEWLPQPSVIDRDAAIASFLLFVGRLAGRASFDVAFREAGVVGAPAGLDAFASAYVPLRLTLADQATVAEARSTVHTALAWVRRRAGFARDVTTRRPTLKRLAGRPFVLPVAVELVAQLPDARGTGADLTLALAADGTSAWLYDASVLAAARVVAMAASTMRSRRLMPHCDGRRCPFSRRRSVNKSSTTGGLRPETLRAITASTR